MKKPLDIRILEYLETLPAASFPLKELELPEEEVTGEELIAEVFRLESAGLVKATTARDGQGKPAIAVIIDRTHFGKAYLERWQAQAREKNPLLRGARWTRDKFLLGVGIVVGGILTKLTEGLFEFLKKHLHPL